MSLHHRAAVFVLLAIAGAGCADDRGSVETTSPAVVDVTTTIVVTRAVDDAELSDPAPTTVPTEATTTTSTTTTTSPGLACVVRLHGKGGAGWDTNTDGGIRFLAPTGNGSAWGGRQWEYATAASYSAAVAIVADAVDAEGCGSVVVHGFSNGASMTTKILCAGETFDGRLVGVVIDDPVADASATGCAPDAGVNVRLYVTGGLAWATAGTDCVAIDWTCEGDRIVGIDAYAAELGVAITPSLFTEHAWYIDAPDPLAWLT
ncbi:MAG: hypothetical protein AAF081_07150 [Actinomycetota bacterium]